MISCLGDLELKTEAEAVCMVGSKELSRLEDDPGVGDKVAGVHEVVAVAAVCCCNRAAS